MNPLQQIDVSTAVTDALTELFDTMMSMDLELSDESELSGLDGVKIAGSVRLAGQVMGGIHVLVSEPFSRRMTAAMLGMEVEDLEGEAKVKDVIGEVCNIVGGSLASKLCDSGMPCWLGPPAYTRGRDFTIEPLNTARHERYVFTHQENPVVVDVDITPQAEDAAAGEDAGRASAPVDPAALSAFDLKAAVSGALVELFDMKLSLDLKPADEGTQPNFDAGRVVGTVGFIGELMGDLNLHVSEGFARKMTAGMLGVDVEKVQGLSDIKDVIGEICNMLAGNIKSKLDDNGFSTRLSTPSMTIGSDFTIESRHMTRNERLKFHHQDESVFVEIGVKLDDDSAARPGADPQALADGMVREQGSTNPASGQGGASSKTGSLVPQGAQAKPSDGPLTGPSFEFLLDVPVAVSVELGRTRKKIDDLLRMATGSIIELTKLAEEPVDIRVNDTLIAKGENVVDNDKYGVRILETISRMHRIRSL